MCKKFIQGLLGGGGGAAKPVPTATARAGGDEGGEALVLAPEVTQAGDSLDPNSGRVRLSGRRGRGTGVAGLSI